MMAAKLFKFKAIALFSCLVLTYYLCDIWLRSNVQTGTETAVVMVELSEQQQEDKLPSLDAWNEAYPNYNVHIFYYMWCIHPIEDLKCLTWLEKNTPTDSDGARLRYDKEYVVTNFYPNQGSYYSDEDVFNFHFMQIRKIGIGVVVVPWRPGKKNDKIDIQKILFKSVFKFAEKQNLKICLHIEAAENRDLPMLRSFMKEFMAEFGSQASLYRRQGKDGRLFPVYYVYDSYLVSPDSWHDLLGPRNASDANDISIRSTELDAIFIGLCVNLRDVTQLMTGGFDGFYTYFAKDGFTYGSSISNWESLAKLAKEQKMLFIPTVAPGYSPFHAKDWDRKGFKNRKNGRVYERTFSEAIDSGASVISVNSFNQWRDGTQIEQAIPMKLNKFRWMDYLPNDPDFYLRLTKKWVRKFREAQV